MWPTTDLPQDQRLLLCLHLGFNEILVQVLPCLLWLRIKTKYTKRTSSKMLLCFTQTFLIPHLHISPHPLNRKGHQRPWSNREIWLIDVPKAIYTKPKQGARGGWAQLGMSWLWVPSRVNPLLSWPCLLFKRSLSFAEWKRMGTFCYRDCLSKKCAMWWSGVIWIEYIFHVGFSAGHPSWQVLSLSDSTLEHHVISR